MFTADGVTLRPLERSDLDRAYAWHCDLEIDIAAGWGPRKSLAMFEKDFERFITEPRADLRVFGIVVEDELIGQIELGLIDREHRRAALGLFLGQRDRWGRGHARRALCLMLDYAFTVENLERVYAEVFGFNQRSLGLMLSAGMTAEGVLRQHDLHNGTRRDLHVFGMLKHEFYQRYRTIFQLPASVTAPEVR